MTRVFKPYDAAEQTAFVRSHCRDCARQLGCTILADARPLDETDPDYPDALVFDDDGRPSCTAFLARLGAAEPEDALPPVTARPVPPAPPEVVSIAVTTIGRGVVDAIAVRPGKRAWTVPFSSVRELFDDQAGDALRDVFALPPPDKARVHRGRQAVTITARSARDGASVSSSVRLKLAGARG